MAIQAATTSKEGARSAQPFNHKESDIRGIGAGGHPKRSTPDAVRLTPAPERRSTLVGAVALAVVPSLAGALLGGLLPDPELKRAVFTGAGALFFGGFLGGVLKLLLDEVFASKRQRDDAASFVVNVLSDIKKVYDRVARARIVISAHKSALTYGDEMRDMIDAHVQLRNVSRALERRAEGVSEEIRSEVIRRIHQMEGYLESLNDEFVEKYKGLSDKQRGYEARSKAVLEQFATDTSRIEPPELPRFVWDSAESLPRLRDFLSTKEDYVKDFEAPIDDASALLRAEHARILRGTTG